MSRPGMAVYPACRVIELMGEHVVPYFQQGKLPTVLVVSLVPTRLPLSSDPGARADQMKRQVVRSLKVLP
jgi:hypothetical protein